MLSPVKQTSRGMNTMLSMIISMMMMLMTKIINDEDLVEVVVEAILYN